MRPVRAWLANLLLNASSLPWHKRASSTNCGRGFSVTRASARVGELLFPVQKVSCPKFGQEHREATRGSAGTAGTTYTVTESRTSPGALLTWPDIAGKFSNKAHKAITNSCCKQSRATLCALCLLHSQAAPWAPIQGQAQCSSQLHILALATGNSRCLGTHKAEGNRCFGAAVSSSVWSLQQKLSALAAEFQSEKPKHPCLVRMLPCAEASQQGSGTHQVSFTTGPAHSDLIQTWPLAQNYVQLSACS